MSDPGARPPRPKRMTPARPPRGVNLTLIYGLMLVGLLIAIGLATLIVLPFYHRR